MTPPCCCRRVHNPAAGCPDGGGWKVRAAAGPRRVPSLPPPGPGQHPPLPSRCAPRTAGRGTRTAAAGLSRWRRTAAGSARTLCSTGRGRRQGSCWQGLCRPIQEGGGGGGAAAVCTQLDCAGAVQTQGWSEAAAECRGWQPGSCPPCWGLRGGGGGGSRAGTPRAVLARDGAVGVGARVAVGHVLQVHYAAQSWVHHDVCHLVGGQVGAWGGWRSEGGGGVRM